MSVPPSRSQAQIAVDKLRNLIFSGQLGAGTDHLESELAEKLGMSRTPVREAVVMLEAQGLLEVRPRKGVRITTLSPTDMAEIYDVLTKLESLAAADAATKGYGQNDLAPLEQIISDMEIALSHKNRKAWALADDAFHMELVRLGGNGRVHAIVSMMADQVRRARMVTLYLRPLPTTSNTAHRSVLEAIRTGDAAQAYAVHHKHREAAKTTLVEILVKNELTAL